MKELYASYDYKEVRIKDQSDYKYVDALSCFGWIMDNEKSKENALYVLKRKRQIANKMELLRLENNLEACRNEISKLQKSIQTYATVAAIVVGLIGTVFIALSTFAIVGTPPNTMLCILFAIPGFIGWILPCFIYQLFKRKRQQKINCFMEEKSDEIDRICDKAMSLMH